MIPSSGDIKPSQFEQARSFYNTEKCFVSRNNLDHELSLDNLSSFTKDCRVWGASIETISIYLKALEEGLLSIKSSGGNSIQLIYCTDGNARKC